MRIKRLKLKNFASIYAGMSLKEIDIDFTKCQNDITLLVGKNGSGKTSILSNLHPFPYLGNLDLRNSQSLILEGKDGLKIFECTDNENEYRFEHHYLLQNGKRTTKCFFKKNGMELNSSGLVSSFYRILEYELGINENFLKIIRLGPNVTDLIAMKASERKEFINTFLSDVDEYTEAFKVVTVESRNIKNQLKMVVNSYNNIGDREVLLERKASLEKAWDEKNKSLNEMNQAKGLLEANISKLPSSKMIEKITEDYNQIQDIIKDYEPLKDTDIGKLRGSYEVAISFVASSQSDVRANESEVSRLKTELNELGLKLLDLDNKWKLLFKENERETIKNKIYEYGEMREKLLEKDIPYDPEKPRDFYDILYDMLNEIATLEGNINYDVHSFEYIRDVSKGCRVDNIVSTIRDKANKKLQKLKEIELSRGVKDLKDMIDLSNQVPEYCTNKNKCPYYLVIQSLMFPSDNKIIKLGNVDKDMLQNVIDATYIFEQIVSIMNRYNSKIKDLSIKDKLNLDFIDWLVSKINNKVYIELKKNQFNELVFSSLETTEEIDKYNKIIKDLTAEYDGLVDSTAIKLINQQISEVSKQIDKTKKQLDSAKNDLAIAKAIYEANEKKCDEIADDVEKANRYMDNKSYIDDTISAYKSAMRAKELSDELYKDLDNTNRMIATLEDEIKKIRYTLENDVTFKLNLQSQLESQKKELESSYETTEVIKESLSSTKGIPLIFIQLYLKNIQILANQILQEMFDENISIDNFVITEKEFRIPYSVNGIPVIDVGFASQGQRTVIVMALSFAIMQQFVSKYNIILLDEMDGPLYRQNKEKFIQIVEKQMKRIGCEQVIMITHNNLFENYPVDLILTSHFENNEYNKSNTIWKI